MDIKTVRERFPQYNHVSDEQLLKAIHQRYYSQVPYEKFASVFKPETTVWEDVKIPFTSAANRLDTAQAMARVGYETAITQAAPTHPLAAMAALAQKGINKIIGPQTADEVFQGQAERIESRNRWANPRQAELGFVPELTGIVASLPAQIAAIPGAAPELMQDLIQKGESVQTAQRAGLANTALNTAMIAAPAAFGKTLTQKVATGAGSNVLLGGTSDAVTRALAEQEATKKAYDPFDPRRRAMDAILGAGFGAVAPKSKPKSKPVEDTINNLKALNEQKEQQAQAEKAAAEQQAAEAAAVQAGARRTQQGELALDTPNEVDVSGVRNPYDVGGRISDLAAGMETTIDSPQRDLFAQGLREQAYNRPDIQAAELALLQAKDRARSTQEQGAINRELEAGYRLLEQDKPRDALGRPLYDLKEQFIPTPASIEESSQTSTKPARPLTEIQQREAFGKAIGAARLYRGSLSSRVNLQAQKAAMTGDFQGVVSALAKSKNAIISEVAKKAKKLNTKIKIDDSAEELYAGKSPLMQQLSIDGAAMHLEALSLLRNLEAQVNALPSGSLLSNEIIGKRIQGRENGEPAGTVSLSDIAEMGNSMFAPFKEGPLKLKTKEDFQALLKEYENLTNEIGETNLRLTSTGSAMMGGVAGAYDVKTNTIRIPEFSARNEGILAHEIVHAQVLKAIAKPDIRQQPIVKRLETLYDFVKTKMELAGSSNRNYRTPYGLSSIQEFIAEGMSNPKFQFELNQIEYKNQSAWKTFTTTIANLIGVKSGTAFTELLSIYGDLTSQTKPFVPKGQRGALDIAQIKEGFKPLYRALSRLTDQAWVKQKFPASEYQTNPDGTPLIMLHGTSKQYDKINVSPEGIHLGFVVPSHLIFTTPGGNPASIGLQPKSWSKATEYPTEPTKLYRNFAKDNITRIRGGANIRPYTIKKGNYPELPFDFGSWDPRMVIPGFYVKSGQRFIDYLVQSAQEKNLPTSKNRFDFLLNRAQSTFGYDSKERASAFNQALKEAGIDGFFYKNKHETLNVADDRYASAAHAKSFVTWNPNNVKNVYEGGPSNFVPKGQRGAVDPDLLGITKALNMFSNAKTQISRAVDSAFSSMEFPKSPDELKAESFKAIPGMKDTPYVAKDPVFENEKPNILAEGKDGGRFWFMTPGRLMAQELRNSNLIKTVGRLFENARNRAAYYNRTVLEPIKREVKRISANDNEVILLRDIMHMELKNGKPFTPDELLASGVSPELSGVLQKMRAAYADVLAKENAARVEAGLKPITALDAYYASRWVGPWTAEVRLKVEVGDNRPHGKLVYFIRERSRGDLNNAIEWIKQKHPELEIINRGYDKNYSMKKGRIEAGYEAMLQILGPEDPLIKDIDAWMKERATQTTENVLGQEKHFKAKGGKLGYAGSRPWVDAAKDAREFLNQQLQYIENGYIWSENQAALREMKKYTSDADILDQQPNNVEYVKELAKLELGQGTLKEIDALENLVAKGLGGNTGFGHMAVGVAKSIFYLKAMGLSTPYIVVSLLQPALVLPPAIIHAKGSFKDAIPALADGPYVLARTLLDDYNYKNPKLNELVDFAKKKKNPFVEEAYRYARDNQVTEVNPLDEIRDPANTSGVPRSIELANKTVGATISLPEIASRSFVYMSFVHGLRNKFDTSTPEGRLQLFEKAAEMTGFAMGVYRKEQKAPIYQRMGMVGNALSTLQTFPLTYMAQGLTYIKEAKKGNPVPLLAFMGTSLMMAGATGLIGLDDATELYNFVKRWILTPSQYAFLEKYPMLADPKGWLVKNTPDWVSYGPVSSLTGTNLFTRTTMGDVVQFGPFESSTTNLIESMFPFVAELYKTGEGAWDIGVGATKGDMKRIKEGGYAMTPSGLRGLYEETVPGFREGTIIKRPSDLKVKQVDRPLDEAEKRMLGFRSMREQKELDLGFANRTQEELRAKQYKNASDSLLNAIYNQKGIPDAFETWVALGGDPRNLNQVQKRYILNSTATKLQQDAMKARSNSPAERRKAQQAIEILNELQR